MIVDSGVVVRQSIMVLQGGQSMSQRLLAPCGQESQKGRHGGREQDKTRQALPPRARIVMYLFSSAQPHMYFSLLPSNFVIL